MEGRKLEGGGERWEGGVCVYAATAQERVEKGK